MSSESKTNIEKAYIIRIDHPLSIERANDCALSCERVGMPYEFWKGSQGVPEKELWNKEPLIVECKHYYSVPVMNATRSHMLLWKHIYDKKETVIILEHDAYLYHNISLEIPDEHIVVLGYKLMDKDKYDYVTAGPPVRLVKRTHHYGAHAYAITWKTAGMLLDELYKYGVRSCIDTGYFMRWCSGDPWGRKDPPHKKETGIPLLITDPIMAVSWVRDERSTVAWNSGTPNHFPLTSFTSNLRK